MQIGEEFLRHNLPLQSHIFIRKVVIGWRCVLQREPLSKISQTRDEQFLDSFGPPPLDVPKNVIVMAPDIEIWVRRSRLGDGIGERVVNAIKRWAVCAV